MNIKLTVPPDTYIDPPEKPNNDLLKPIQNLKQLLRVEWDVESPRFRAAAFKLGVEASSLILK